MTIALLDYARTLIDMAKTVTNTSKQLTDPALMYAHAQALIAFDTALKLDDLLCLLKDAEWIARSAHRDGEEVQIVSLLTE